MKKYLLGFILGVFACISVSVVFAKPSDSNSFDMLANILEDIRIFVEEISMKFGNVEVSQDGSVQVEVNNTTPLDVNVVNPSSPVTNYKVISLIENGPVNPGDDLIIETAGFNRVVMMKTEACQYEGDWEIDGVREGYVNFPQNQRMDGRGVDGEKLHLYTSGSCSVANETIKVYLSR